MAMYEYKALMEDIYPDGTSQIVETAIFAPSGKHAKREAAKLDEDWYRFTGVVYKCRSLPRSHWAYDMGDDYWNE